MTAPLQLQVQPVQPSFTSRGAAMVRRAQQVWLLPRVKLLFLWMPTERMIRSISASWLHRF